MQACIQDVQSASPPSTLPSKISDYDTLLQELKSARVMNAFPPVYRFNALVPFTNFLESLGKANFDYILTTDERTLRSKGEHNAAFYKQIIPDATEAIMQQADGFESHASDAFQEVISDLYDSYLSDADRKGVKRPDKGVLPPLGGCWEIPSSHIFRLFWQNQNFCKSPILRYM